MQIKQCYIFIFLTSFPLSFYAQTITNTGTANVPCCSFADSVDYNLDGIYDIKISSRFGVDNFAFFTNSLNNIEISEQANFGQTFTNYTSVGLYLMLTATTFLCNDWFPAWIPGDPPKYVGFRDINNQTDTIYGWMKINFAGQQNSCLDTMFVLETTYNTEPNAPLFAGEKIVLAGVSEVKKEPENIHFYPNPASDKIQVINKLNVSLKLQIKNISGKIVVDKIELLPHQNIQLSTTLLAKGIYIIESKSSHSSSFQKLVIR